MYQLVNHGKNCEDFQHEPEVNILPNDMYPSEIEDEVENLPNQINPEQAEEEEDEILLQDDNEIHPAEFGEDEELVEFHNIFEEAICQ